MKKILLLLLLATLGIQAQTLQNPTYGNVKLKNNTTDNSATKVNVQSTDGTINTISKSDLVNVVDVNDVPSLPLIGDGGKIYVVKNINKIYRWNGTFYPELSVTNITYQSVIDALTFTPENVANKNTANGYAGLGSDGKLISSQLPSITISDTFVTASQAAMLSLTAETGDVAVRTDLNKSYILKENNPTVLASWQELLTPTSEVTSVNGRTGAVVVTKADVSLNNADNTSDINKPISTATQTVLDLKANLASPSLTGTPTAPTPTTTTGIANKSYVDGLNSGNVKLTGIQMITGKKTFSGGIDMNSSPIQWLSAAVIPTGNQTATITRLNNDVSVGTGNANIQFASFNTLELSSNKTFTFPNQSGTFALTSNPSSLTATSFIKSSAPATNILLAGGGDIAQNTAFNKNFGTTAGTVAEGNDSRFTDSRNPLPNSSNYIQNQNASAQSANMWISGSVSSTSFKSSTSIFTDNGYWGTTIFSSRDGSNANFAFLKNDTTPIFFSPKNTVDVVFNGAAIIYSSVTASSYTATSLPVFENNASASSLAVGQFYRTSTGVLMVKF